MSAYVFLLFSLLMVGEIKADDVTNALQTQLENLQNREVVLEKNLSLIQQKEQFSLEAALRSSIKDFLKNETKGLLDVDQAFQTAVHQYAQLLISMSEDLTPLYYDSLFWVRYIPAYLNQEDVLELQKEKITYPLSATYLKILKDFSQTYYAYKTFFEQWPTDKQSSPAAQFYGKAKDAYIRFSTTQAFVVSLLAQQQDSETTQGQMNVLITRFKSQLYDHLESPSLSDKTQYDHLLSVYAAQLNNATELQDFKQYKVWALINSLLYYRKLAGIPTPDDLLSAELFHISYTSLASLMDTYQKKWSYYQDAQFALNTLSAYENNCKILLAPTPLPMPNPAPKPLPVPEPAAPQKTIGEQLDDYINNHFSDAMLVTLNVEKTLSLYNNLLEDYKNSKEYQETDYTGYVAWADFVPLRIAELNVIEVKMDASVSQRRAVVFAFNQALNSFRKTTSWAYLRNNYPSLFKEITDICSQYANWLGKQR